METKNLFQYVKENIKISDYVRSLPETKGLHSVGGNEYRCNNIIAQGDGTTSMSIKDDEGYFKVFSHGQEGGDIITLYKLTRGSENDTMRDACIELAEYMGLQIPEEMMQVTYSPKPKMISTMNNTMEILHKYLMKSNNEDAQIAREYLFKERQMSKKLVQEWKLGLFPEDERLARKILLKCGNNDIDILIKTGLFNSKKDNRTNLHYITMRGRLSFPIFSKKGDCIAFSSRIIDDINCSAKNAKYINTSNNELYNKSEVLYGQHLIRKNIDKVVICEGNLDVIALNEILDDNSIALATCGTALGETHITTLKDIKAKKYTIMFDSDEAGKAAALQPFWMINHFPFVSLSEIKSGKDPWEAYITGYDIKKDIQYDVPMVITAPKYAFDLKEKIEFIEWFGKTYNNLSFSDDKQKFFDSAQQYSGIREKELKSATRGIKASNRKNNKTNDNNIVLSNSVKLMISALLSIKNVRLRKFIAFPLLRKNNTEVLYEICGSLNDTDDQAIRVSLGYKNTEYEYLHNTVFNLLKDDEESKEIQYAFCKYLSYSIISYWKTNGIPEEGYDYLLPLNMITSDVSTKSNQDKMLLLFEALSLN